MAALFSRILTRYRALTYAGAPDAASDFSVALPLPATVGQGTLRIAVMIHLFHAEMATEFRRLIEAAGIRADMLITTDSIVKEEAIGAMFAGYGAGGVTIKQVPNRGRDIQPKLTAFVDRYADYDLILFLHSKKSLHVTSERDWRAFLLDHLVGSPAVVASILDIFRCNDDVGLLFPQHFEPLRRFVTWAEGGNFAAARPLARRLGLRMSPRIPIDFPSGSMFWCRPAALRPLLDLHLSANDFPEELAQTDGTIAHAIERLFLFSVERAGYRWLKVALPHHFERQESIVRLDDANAVCDFLDRHGSSLLQNMG